MKTFQAAKLFNYFAWKSAAEVTFGCFFMVWMVTRVWIYPYCVLGSIYADASPAFGGPYPAGQYCISISHTKLRRNSNFEHTIENDYEQRSCAHYYIISFGPFFLHLVIKTQISQETEVFNSSKIVVFSEAW